MYIFVSRLFVVVLAVAFASAALAEDHPNLSAAQASRLAAQLANADCQRRFSSSPFGASAAKAHLTRGRWYWRAIEGHGRSDLVADVSFSQSGDAATVRVDLMDSRR
jgi:hypothetical protein